MCELHFHEYLQSIILYYCNHKRKRRCIEDFLKQNNDSVDFLEYKKRKGNYTLDCFGNIIVKY